jgi:hypothetical protein
MSRLTDAIHWLEVRLNRPLLPTAPDHNFWSLYQSDGVQLDHAPPSLRTAAARPTDLMIALTTYNRPDSCERILAALPGLLASAGRPLRVHVLVIKDAGGAEYGAVERVAGERLGDRLTWMEARAPLGKRGYWKTYQTMFLAARLLQPTHALFLQDDLEFSAGLLRECYALFDALAQDERPRVLYLFASDDDEPEGRWIHFRRREAIPGARLTQWLDLAGFFTDRVVLELLRFRVIPVSERRWKEKPYSSGVGEQLTRRLFGRANLYQAAPPLVFHGASPSEMNPEARAERALDNRSLGGTRER